jgi:4-hydroxythreonine-4-phosphate dehydrogenase
VVVVDADTRESDAPGAAAAVARIAVGVPRDADVLKKIDSALRGQIAAELAAVRDALPGRLLVVAPAFPRAGRVTRQGVQLVHGVPLHRTNAWAAEADEPPHSVAEALRGLPVRNVPRDSPRLRAELEAAAGAGEVAVCDAAEDRDLDALVEAAATIDVVWAGAAGLAAALARAAPRPHDASRWRPAGARYLAVIGSATSVAAGQAAQLRRAGADLVDIPRAILAQGDAGEIARVAGDLLARVNRRSVVVTVDGAPERASAVAVRRALAAVVAPAAAEMPLLAAVGGATARAVFEAVGIRALELVAEPEPGVAVARAGGRDLVIKAGAFGDAGTLVRVLNGGSPA